MKRKAKKKFKKKYLLLLLLIIPISFLFFNLKAADDWLNYGLGNLKYKNYKIEPVNCTQEPYTNLCALAARSTPGRMNYIQRKAVSYGYEPELVLIDHNKMSDVVVLITRHPQKPYTVFSAHYDKKLSNKEFEAGMDNTAGVYSLLALLYNLRTVMHNNNIAVVFTGEEETGFYGATTFINYAKANNLQIKDYIVVDSIGRGTTYIGSTGQSSGFLFRIPFGKEVVYAPYWWNEHKWFLANPYSYPNEQIVSKFRKIARENKIPFLVYDKMIAWGEDQQYVMTGAPTVRIYSDDFQYYFNKIHTLEDKGEYLDKKSLDETVALLTYYAIS